MGKHYDNVLFSDIQVAGKKNVVADALSQRPHVSAVSIVYHDERA